MAAATKGIRMMASEPMARLCSRGTQALIFEALLKRAHLTPIRAIQPETPST